MRSFLVAPIALAVSFLFACGDDPTPMPADDGYALGNHPAPPSDSATAIVSTGAPETCGNGLDDNANGEVDEGCPCTEGATQRCFAGKASLAGIGACTMGTQTCVSSGGSEIKTVKWGPCTGGGSATTESCNGVDDDCNGKTDDAPSCGGGTGADAGKPPSSQSQQPCQGVGLIWASVGDKCIDDGGQSDKDDDLQVFCVNNIARFCLSKEACPWRDGGVTADDVTCSTAGLASTYFVSSRQACGEWEGHQRICCSPTGQVSFSGC